MRHKLALIALLVLISPSSDAQVVRQVTDVETVTSAYYGALDDAGSVVFVNSSTNRFGGNPQHAFQLLRFDAVTGAGTTPALFDDGVAYVRQYGVSVSDDGQWVALTSRGDLTGQNHDQGMEVFVMREDGTQLSQLTSDPAPNGGSVSKVVMAGSGNRLAFVSNSDLLGTNAGQVQQLFVINRDGTGLAQLTTLAVGQIDYLDISDDGNRLTFTTDGDPTGGNADGNYEVFAINGDGTNLRQLSSSTSGTSENVVISGNGATIAFQSYSDLLGSNPEGSLEIFAAEWDGTNLRQLTNGTDPLGGPALSAHPTITDDAQFVFFSSSQGSLPIGPNPDGSFEIWRIGSDGTGLTVMNNFLGNSYYPVASGNGSRISFLFYGGSGCDGSSIPDDTAGQLCAMDGSGNNIVKLVEHRSSAHYEPDITPDGTRIVFSSNADLTGGDQGAGQIYRMQADGSDLFQLTNFTTGGRSEFPSIAADGNLIVFDSSNNDDSSNPTLTLHIYRIFADGTGLLRLTANEVGDSYLPVVSSDGSAVVFASLADHTGGNSDGSAELFKINPDGTGMVQLTSVVDPDFVSYFAVDQSGTWVAFSAKADLTGDNPDKSYELFRVRTDGTGMEQLTDDPTVDGFLSYTDISGSGELIVYSSRNDPLGTNPEGNLEIFSFNTSTVTIEQLTVTAEGDSYWPKLSEDGNFVYFVSDAPFSEKDPDEPYHVFRLTLGTGTVERVGGLGFGNLTPFYEIRTPAITDGDGSRAVFAAEGNFVEQNFDVERELFLIDLSTAAGIEISSGAAPTSLSWDVNAGPIRYDAIRGDVANLQPADPGVVDLGPVICLEDDSPDADTIGFEDIETPALGQALFYVYRGSEAVDAGPGSYGQASDGAERVAGAGDCQP